MTILHQNAILDSTLGFGKVVACPGRIMRVCWNRQTGTFEVRVSLTCGFKSHRSHHTCGEQVAHRRFSISKQNHQLCW